MNVRMIWPGPLEGGPKGSPGPAKESGEPFSARLKHAFDQTVEGPRPDGPKPSPDRNRSPEKERAPKDPNRRLSKPTEQKTTVNEKEPTHPSKSDDRLTAPKESTPKEGDVSPKSCSEEASPVPPRKWENPLKGSETIVEGVPVLPDLETALLGIPTEGHVLLVPLTPPESVPLAGEQNMAQEGDVSLTLLAPADGDNRPVPPSELPEETGGKPESESKDELSKKQTLPLEGSPPILPPAGLPAIVPLDPLVSVEGGVTVAPLNEDLAVAPVATDPKNVPLPLADETKTTTKTPVDISSPKEAPSLPEAAPSKKKTQSLPPKKETSSSEPVLPGEAKTSPEGQAFRVPVEPVGKQDRAEPEGSSSKDIEITEIKKNDPPPKEVPLTPAVFSPAGRAPVLKTTDPLSIGKEPSGIAPLHAGPVASTGGPFPERAEAARVSAVADGTKAGPAATPSPVDLARQIHVHLESGRSVVRIDLHPEHLGELRISLETKGKDVSMQFTVDNENARTTVVAGLREITGSLSTLGWSVNGLAVHVSSGGVGNGRGESNGPLWGEGPKNSNTLLPEPKTVSPQRETGQWRVDLVA